MIISCKKHQEHQSKESFYWITNSVRSYPNPDPNPYKHEGLKSNEGGRLVVALLLPVLLVLYYQHKA